ncbi:hypothetical protein KY290_031008 [Solanum tuberosum]|uniref:Uncharacterized protein n=1 Tax=Solanum tuberosum TaxID=4113 RepID=A0ABQ7UBE3_SOLTU|nr:hypothetical protein KY290_031008 [Solanum tuberosum]
MGFWEPNTVTFKLLNFEITPTLEKFSSLTELPIRGRLLMIPSAICTGDILSLFDLHIFRSLRYVDNRQVELDYFFQRFGRSEGYYEYQREFECTRGAWEHMRPRVFIMAFLGVMVFPIRCFHFSLAGKIRNLQAEWEYTIDLEIREEKWYTPEYYASRNTVSHMAHPSVHGHWGFVENQQIDWIRESVLPRMGFTTSMYNQIVPGSIDYLIQVVEEEEEDPEEDAEEDPEEDPKEIPEEEVEEDHMEVFETGSNIYDPRDGGGDRHVS